MPGENGDYNGSSGGTGEVDLSGLVDDVGGLIDEIFNGDFWDFINQLGCMTSSFKLRDLKDRFPAAINAMRERSGVDVSMTVENVNEFSKRLSHHLAGFANNPGGGCRGTYSEKYIEMLNTYKDELHNLFLSSGFSVSNDTTGIPNWPSGWKLAQNYSQTDINVDDGYMFHGSQSFVYRTYVYADGSGNEYGYVDPVNPGNYEGGGVFENGGGVFNPTISNFNVMNYALGGLLLFGFYKYAKDNKILDSKKWK